MATAFSPAVASAELTGCDNVIVIHISDTHVAVDEGGSMYIEADWDVDLTTDASKPVKLVFVLGSGYEPDAQINVYGVTQSLPGTQASMGMFEYVMFDEEYLEFDVLGPSQGAPTPPIIIHRPPSPDPEPT